MEYVFTSKEHGTFLPSGKVEMTPAEVEAHNAKLEAAELAEWSKAPECWVVYVGDGANVTSWRGVVLGTIISRHNYKMPAPRWNFEGPIRMQAIRFKGTNGATYYGRYGVANSQLCRVRKAKG